jgi:DNA-binding HxlR family transcriptional regulator
MPEFKYQGKLYYNPVEFAMDRIGGTWKMPLLWRLNEKTLRYGELKKSMPKVTHKMLTSALRELEEEGFIHRKAYPVIPPKVEYSLTERGKRSILVIDVLRQYGISLMGEFGVAPTKEPGHTQP